MFAIIGWIKLFNHLTSDNRDDLAIAPLILFFIGIFFGIIGIFMEVMK